MVVSRDFNIAAFAAVLCLPALAGAQIVVLDQQPQSVQSIQAQITDNGCVVAQTPITRSIADDFVVTASVAVTTVRWLGFYDRPEAPRDPEVFRILFHTNIPGDLPGPVVAQPLLTVTQQLMSLPGSTSVYSFEATFDPLTLAPGTYWIELFETDDSTDDCFGWMYGANNDAVRGRLGTVASDDGAPGVTWAAQNPALVPAFDVQIFGQIPEVEATAIPALDGIGLALLAGALGLMGTVALRSMRRR